MSNFIRALAEMNEWSILLLAHDNVLNVFSRNREKSSHRSFSLAFVARGTWSCYSILLDCNVSSEAPTCVAWRMWNDWWMYSCVCAVVRVCGCACVRLCVREWVCVCTCTQRERDPSVSPKQLFARVGFAIAPKLIFSTQHLNTVSLPRTTKCYKKLKVLF